MVRKGRRTTKSNARSINSDVKLVNRSPKRVGDFSCSDSYKFGEAVNRHHVSSNNVEHVPIKKRRHLIQSSSPCQLPSRCCEEAVPSEFFLPTQSEELELLGQMSSDSYSSGQFPSVIKGNIMDDKLTEVTNVGYYKGGDSSGITILAAAACISGIDDTSSEKLEHNNLDSAGGEMLPDTKVVECAASPKKFPIVLEDLSECIEDGEFVRSISPKIDRQYWDLNTSMDSWEQPNNDDAVWSNVSNNVIYNEKRSEEVKTNIPKDHSSSDTFPDNNNVEKCIPLLADTEEYKSGTVSSLNATCVEEISASNMGHLKAIVREIPHPDESASKVSASSVTGEVNGKQDIVSAPITIITDSGVQFERKELIPNCAANSCISNDEDQSLQQSRDLKKHGLPGPPHTDGTASQSMKFRMSSSLEEDAHNNPDVSHGDLVKHNEYVPGFQAGNDDSLFEHGKLQGPVLFPWEENDGDYEMECVDYGSDGDDLLHSSGDHKDAELVEGSSQGIETINSSASICREADLGKTNPLKTCSKQSLRGDSHLIDVCRQNESGAADHAGMSMEGNIDPIEGQGTDNMDSLGFCEAFDKETGSRTQKGRLQSHIEVPLRLDATESKEEKCRNPHVAGSSYPRLKRDYSPKGRYFSAHYHPRGKNVVKGNWDTRNNQYLSRYNDYENHGFSWRRHFTTSNGDFETDLHHYHPHSPMGYSPKRSIVVRRTSVDRDDDCLDVPRRLVRGGINREEREGFRRRTNHQQIVRVFTKKGHISLPRRSHSRSRSPGSQREGTQRRRTRPSMSPDSSRTRVPFQKPHAAKRGREGFLSSTLDQNPRWTDDRSFAGNHLRQERVRLGDIGRLRFGDVGSHLGKPDDYSRRRFEPESRYDNQRRHDEMMQQQGRRHFDDRRSALKRYREDVSS
ncbi:unnamed protein product [Cuscuta campestris]|uniref:Uncharacterized protein n=1 Tax=Cuscuta campestris TaxID=132261 RepID=A0A484KLU6_9ASTE|nr:unnamed protein product [Cuscuta campestris]